MFYKKEEGEAQDDEDRLIAGIDVEIEEDDGAESDIIPAQVIENHQKNSMKRVAPNPKRDQSRKSSSISTKQMNDQALDKKSIEDKVGST